MAKYKKEISIFLIGFIAYFTLGLLYSYYLGTYNFWNVLFDIDTPRVFEDLTVFSGSHYRATVHPLFVLFFQPICKILGFILKDCALGCLLVQGCFAAISLVAVYIILKKLKLSNRSCNLLTVLFGTSFGQIVFSSNIETYIFAQGLLTLLWVFAAYKIDKEYSLIDYVILTILGVCSIAVTLTNVVQFIIVLFFGLMINKKVKNGFFKTIIVGISALSLSVLLASVQNIIWPSAPNFFTKNITDFIYHTSEESLYVDSSFNINKVINILNVTFSYSFNLGSLYIPRTGVYLTFNYSNIINIISIIIGIAFLVLNVYYVIKTKFDLKNDKLYYALLCTLLFNVVFHLFYGNSIAFLYVCHFNFILILLLGYIISKLNIKIFENRIINNSLIVLIIANAIRLCLVMFILLLPKYNPVEHFRIIPFLILLISLILLCCFLFDKKTIKIISIIISIIFIVGSYYLVNNINKLDDCDELCDYKMKLDKYEKQLKEMKNSFMIETYEDTDEAIGVMFFGMADRHKMIYKAGKLYDAKTEEVIKEFDYDEEIIIPNDYTVVLKNNDDIYKIVENEKGIYLYDNDSVETLSEGNVKINLPTFEDYKYSEILRVLHQEILFNVDGNEPKPNIWGYTQAYYRDAMLVTKVFEETNNTDILLDWVNDIEKIYDNSRSTEIDEADNLGELLYIIGATGADREDLVNKIIKEIYRLKDNDNHISGMVDGYVQTYYPTLLALYGGQKLGIDIDLDYPTIDDGYARLTWYSDYKVAASNSQDSSYYPYINWGFYHYSPYGRLFILDELYPLTYEGGEDNPNYKVENECFISDFYCEKDMYIAHSWSASEMFLMLIGY